MKPRALVVDDSLTVRMDLIDALTIADFEAVGAGSVAEARAALAKDHFDIAILDVRLGDGDGVELLGEIRAKENASKRMAVMMLSSEAEVRDRIRGLERGADEYAAKPYVVSWVIARARELTQRLKSPDGRPVVLVIDDSISFREAMREALEGHSYQAVLAATGEDGLREAPAIRPALVICDGDLPGIDGITVIRRLRLDAALRHTPILMISGSEIADGEMSAFEAGVDGYLLKTTAPEEIVARIAALLASSREAPVASVRSALATQNILVVGKGLAHVIAALRQETFDVATAASTDDALLLLKHASPACVLAEAAVESCRALRTAVRRPSAIVALVSANDDSSLAIDCLGAGADEVVSRDTPVALLVARVRAQIRRKQADEEAKRDAEASAATLVSTARAKHLAELEQKNAELEVANGELESFSYTVSHDLRAPLRAIEGFARALEEDDGHLLDADGKRHLGRICGATNRMNELIDDLLALSRVTRAEIVRSEVDVSALAKTVVAVLRSRTPARRVEVEIEDGLVARADPSLLRAVLENLLENAWKFTMKNDDTRITVGAAEQNGERAFFVGDNGAGFDMAQASMLFRPFKRLHSPKEFEGTGIGLATVRRIIVRHGGRVWVEAAPGQGATFWFTLG